MSAEEMRGNALRAVWQAGLLSYKLREYQRSAYEKTWEAILNPDCLKFTLNISRRWGKSTVATLIATELCLRVPGATIRFAAPSGKELRKITNPIMKWLLADCPTDLRPRFNSHDGVWIFPNGSEFHLSGVNDGHADNLRGTGAHLASIDEAGFVDDLHYLVSSVLMPQTLDTGGTLILTSTPPLTPAHEYVAMAWDCQALGNYVHRDIYSTDFSPAKIAAYAKEAGGVTSTTWKREYLAMFVVDAALSVVPEWSDTYIQDIKRDDCWQYYHRYVSLDIGIRDFSAALFAYYDFRKATLIVEDELILNGNQLTSQLLSEEITKVEERLNYHSGRGVYQRVSDNDNLMLLSDMRTYHKLPFQPTSKDELVAMVNETRLWVQQGRLRVHPRCKNLAGAVKNGIWRNERYIGREFARTDVYGHFDALAALIYLTRNIDQSTNPLPVMYGLNAHTQFIPESVLDRASDTANTLKKAFGLGIGK